MIVGAHALAHYGAPRFTGDIDIFVCPESVNAQRIMVALKEFGFASLPLSPEDFLAPEHVVQLGVAPVRIDIMTSISGVSWEEAKGGRVEGKYGDIKVFFIGKKEYIRNKRATGRKQDLADLDAIGEL